MEQHLSFGIMLLRLGNVTIIYFCRENMHNKLYIYRPAQITSNSHFVVYVTLNIQQVVKAVSEICCGSKRNQDLAR